MPTPDDPLPPDPWHFPLDEHKKPGNENEPAINWEAVAIIALTLVLAYFVFIPAFRWLIGLIF